MSVIKKETFEIIKILSEFTILASSLVYIDQKQINKINKSMIILITLYMLFTAVW